tara:strand:- start:2515 stop:2847 length:333 start_codon:yes stop_codon:yes gene_type:complete
MKKKKPYFPNNWEQLRATPYMLFDPMEFDVFMDWKIGGYEIPSSIAAIVRVKDIDTCKVKEYVYQRRHAAQKKVTKLMTGGVPREIVVCTDGAVHFIYPKNYEIFSNEHA